MRVNPERITEARQIRGLNISQLSQGLNVTRQAVSSYEQGNRKPSDSVLDNMGKILNFPIDFFYKESDKTISNSTIFFRSLKSAEAGLRTATEWKCKWTGEVYFFLEKLLNLPPTNLPITDFILLKNSLSDDDIDQLSLLVRQYWKLGEGQIIQLLPVLERNGIVVSKGKVSGNDTDACSTWINGKPIIFIGDKPDQMGASCRQNFTLAHELGHLLMHNHLTQDDIQMTGALKRIEREANRFASAFLLPQGSFLQEVHSTSLDFFVGLKRKWNVSVAAMVYRCGDLGLLSDEELLNLRKQISFRKWRKEEPLDRDIPLQNARLFQKAMHMLLSDNALTAYDILNFFKWPTEDLEEICSLPTNFFYPIDNNDIPIYLV